jgi:hypothetical protein
LIVGKIHILDQIAELARRYPPYGIPEKPVPEPPTVIARQKISMEVDYELAEETIESIKPKEIKKEGLSEYFLYIIQGTETIPTGWTKRLPSFAQKNIPEVNLYKYEEERFGNSVVRFLSFKNDKEHNLGIEPLPDGLIKVSRKLDEAGHLSYTGEVNSKYIPIDEDVELNLGPAQDIEVEPKLMDYKTSNYLFNASGGNISGWDEEKEYEVKVSNYRPLPIKVEIIRNFPHQYWEVVHKGDSGVYEKIDQEKVSLM